MDETTGRLKNEMPKCPHCGKLARPNILMFGDWGWVDKYSERQLDELTAWLRMPKCLVVVEMGAGKALPTIRRFSERKGQRVIRIKPREGAFSPRVGVGLPERAAAGLQQLDELLNSR